MIFVDVYLVLWYTVNSGAIKCEGEEGMEEKDRRDRNVDLGIIIALLIAIVSFFIFTAGVVVSRSSNYNTYSNKDTIANREAKEENESAKKEEETQTQKNKEETQKQDGRYKIGDTWTVDGQWSLTVNSVEETANRNEYSDIHPAAVYIITYTYTNLGRAGGLFMTMDNKIVDSTGKMGQSYPGDISIHPQDTPAGATCQAQCCISVDNPGNFEIYMDEYDDENNQQSAVFSIEF